MLVQLPAGHVERPQLALMLPLEFFPLALPLDTLQLIIDGLGVQAMAALKVPEGERQKYMDLLERQ